MRRPYLVPRLVRWVAPVAWLADSETVGSRPNQATTLSTVANHSGKPNSLRKVPMTTGPKYLISVQMVLDREVGGGQRLWMRCSSDGKS